nr:G-type lectin S-receptor-like serine/threonine-protein kinase At4g03230 [Tanacetum cinerariifolium]
MNVDYDSCDDNMYEGIEIPDNIQSICDNLDIKVPAKDNITTGEFINGVNYLESPEKKFQMGFFSRVITSEVRRYVGIWYTMDPKTVVWVANRDMPVLDSTGVFTVKEDGNAVVVNKDGMVYFSTPTTTEFGP